MRIGQSTNEHGTPVAEYQCESCGQTFTVCPAPAANEDDAWSGCQMEECESYDPARDLDKAIEEGRVRQVDLPNGKIRLIPFQVIEGGRDSKQPEGDEL